MPGLAMRMKSRGVKPGLWIRPLLSVDSLPKAWRMPANGLAAPPKPPFFIIDPSIPEALQYLQKAVQGVVGWGFELIKHDFSTYDIFGRWGFQMGAAFTNSGWHFADRSKTSAEIVLQFYRALREAAGSACLLGCNTIGHLGAGLFELQRIGDDTSGKEWELTRKMGVNTLAFRLPQHGSFFSTDADCVPLTPAIPWEMTRQWLDLVARSGTPLFVSVKPSSCGAEQRKALQAAFSAASQPQPPAEPLNWMETTTPDRWRLGGKEVAFQWCGDEGQFPFAS
jgi:alpha-galactosidase